MKLTAKTIKLLMDATTLIVLKFYSFPRLLTYLLLFNLYLSNLKIISIRRIKDGANQSLFWDAPSVPLLQDIVGAA